MRLTPLTRSSGSSPRTRGTGQCHPEEGLGNRFIPADAGNRARPVGAVRQRAVHPRGRGEQTVASTTEAVAPGSSPRTRGTGVPADDWRAYHRFIPADAGNRLSRPALLIPGAVHPRGRGEQADCAEWLGQATGSSPRTRGTEGPASGLPDPGRFIPADAGNRWRRNLTPSPRAVHPRGRGEQR